MTQLPLPGYKAGAGISPQSGSEKRNESLLGASSSHPSYLVAGPHSQVRTQLMWVNRLLAYDVNSSVSVISVRELREALSRFQKEVRALALGLELGADGSRSRSQTRTGPRSGSRTVKTRTRNFKA